MNNARVEHYIVQGDPTLAKSAFSAVAPFVMVVAKTTRQLCGGKSQLIFRNAADLALCLNSVDCGEASGVQKSGWSLAGQFNQIDF